MVANPTPRCHDGGFAGLAKARFAALSDDGAGAGTAGATGPNAIEAALGVAAKARDGALAAGNFFGPIFSAGWAIRVLGRARQA